MLPTISGEPRRPRKAKPRPTISGELDDTKLRKSCAVRTHRHKLVVVLHAGSLLQRKYPACLEVRNSNNYRRLTLENQNLDKTWSIRASTKLQNQRDTSRSADAAAAVRRADATRCRGTRGAGRCASRADASKSAASDMLGQKKVSAEAFAEC